MTQTFAFDAYGTVFDVTSTNKEIRKHYPEKAEEIGRLWREKQLSYAFLRQVMGRYDDFFELTRRALDFAVFSLGLEIDEPRAKDLMEAYMHLEPFAESAEVIGKLPGEKVVFSNGTKSMLTGLLKNSPLENYFDRLVSADEIKQYKPSPAAYQYLMEKLGKKRDEVTFVSSNAWDIAGAKSFGFNTVWINRGGESFDELGVTPDGEGASLEHLLQMYKGL